VPKDFRTSDMSLAAYLVTAGCRLVDAKVSEDSTYDRIKVNFIFDPSNENISRLKTAFFTKEAKVVAADFAANLKNLKTLVHSEKEGWKALNRNAK